MVGGHSVTAPEMRAVARVGPCSGVLIKDDAVLTSAHCLAWSIDHVVIGKRDVPVTECVRHPEFVPGDVLHDIALCRLDRRLVQEVAVVDDAPSLSLSTPVAIAGYGLPGALADDGDALRQVDTRVSAARDGIVEVGTPERTACRGDSGGPVFVAREGGLRLTAIIHGSSGAICASRAEAIPLAAHRAWLAAIGALPQSKPPAKGWLITGSATFVFMALLVAVARWRKPQRSGSPRVQHGRRRQQRPTETPPAGPPPK